MRIVRNLVQGSPSWWNIRRGIPTGSEFHRVMTSAKGEYAAGAGSYMDELIAGAIGWKPSFQGSPDTERGNRMEESALPWLAYEHGIATEKVGFVLSDCGTYGVSPDALVARTTKPVEVKAPDLHTFIGWKREVKATKQIPVKHKVQVHFEIFTCEADSGIFVAYAEHPSIANMMLEVKRDAFTDKIGPYLARFTKELDELAADVFGPAYEEYRDGLAKGRAEALASHPQPSPQPA